MSLTFPAIDPVLIEIGPLAIRWYSLAYIAGLFGGWWLLTRQLRLMRLTREQLDDLLLWVLLGVILGGRIGYVLFYNLPYFLENPIEILTVWHGGMSFHGGMLGSIAAVFLFTRRHKLAFLPAMDGVAMVAPLGLGLGRLANFINGELYGRVTDAPWGMIFPNGGPLPRHPSQIYEALTEGLLLFLLLWGLKAAGADRRPGVIGGSFLLGYAVARAACELFREPDAHLGFLFAGATMGHLLSLPMALAGLFVILRALKRRPTTA